MIFLQIDALRMSRYHSQNCDQHMYNSLSYLALLSPPLGLEKPSIYVLSILVHKRPEVPIVVHGELRAFDLHRFKSSLSV